MNLNIEEERPPVPADLNSLMKELLELSQRAQYENPSGGQPRPAHRNPK